MCLIREMEAFEIWHCISQIVWVGVRLYLTYNERHCTVRQSLSTHVKKNGGSSTRTAGNIYI